MIKIPQHELIKINDLLKKNKKLLNLKYIIANGILESSGTKVGEMKIKTQKINSQFEGCIFFKEIEFSDYDYIIVGHKYFITLYDDDDKYLATSIYVHNKYRKRGYARSFLSSTFDLDKKVVFDTPYDGIKKIIEENPAFENFYRGDYNEL